MKRILPILLTLSFAWLCLSCREEYEPELEVSEIGVLIVEGYLDSEGLESELRLSRTVPLSSNNKVLAEKGAQIRLIAPGGEEYVFQEIGDGRYKFAWDLDENLEYTLEIFLSDGEKYISDPMKPIVTPPILDAGYIRDEEGIEVFLNTQGNQDADDFLWSFEETWIFRPRIRTTYIYRPDIGDVTPRTDEERIDLCYKSVRNSDVLLETSSRFEDQVVFRQTITQIPEGDERMMERYSILISQKAIGPKDVEFWETLKRNSDDLGSIFSPLPSAIRGNIHMEADPDRPVIGQVSLGVVRQQRVYIDREDILPWVSTDDQFDDCFISQDTVFTYSYKNVFTSGAVLPARPILEGFSIIGYLSAPNRCADCSLYADQKRPDFWED